MSMPRPSRPLLLGLDIGTASAKGVLVRPDGRIVAEAQSAHQTSFPRPGWVEHDPESVWWADVVAITRQLSAQAASLGTIVGVGVSGIGPCLLPVDAAGTPLRPAILYGIDTRAEAEIAELDERFGREAILARGGSPLTFQAVGPKLLWLQHHEPEVWERTRRFHMASSLVVERLTGEYVLDHHSASQCDPLYDMTEAGWARDWAEIVAPGLELPRLAWSDEVVGHVHAAGAAATGLPVGTPVVAGAVDAWAEAFSAGVRDPGDTMLMYGTTMFIVGIAEDGRPRAPLWLTMGVSRNVRTVAAGLSASGGVTAWFRDLIADADFGELYAQAAASPPGAKGLLTLPYFGMARSPLFDARARGVIVGLTLTHNRGDLLRAILEGTAFEVRHNLEVMAEAGAPARRLFAVGGGTRSGVWSRIVTDVTGQPQVVPAQTIGASFGDALLAARGVGLAGPDTRWDSGAQVLEPDLSLADLYAERYRLFRRLYEDTREEIHALARSQEAEAEALAVGG